MSPGSPVPLSDSISQIAATDAILSCGRGKKRRYRSHEGGGSTRQRLRLSHGGGGSTGQRLRLSHDGGGSTRQRLRLSHEGRENAKAVSYLVEDALGLHWLDLVLWRNPGTQKISSAAQWTREREEHRGEGRGRVKWRVEASGRLWKRGVQRGAERNERRDGAEEGYVG